MLEVLADDSNFCGMAMELLGGLNSSSDWSLPLQGPLLSECGIL